MLEALALVSGATNILGGIFGASSARKEARANMSAIAQEKSWNIGVMRRNKADILEQNFLSAYASGISSATGSTRAIIENNQNVLDNEIRFRESQYDIAYANQEAKSKQKFLGLF